MTTLHLNLGNRGYDITVGQSLLARADEYLNLNRKIFILTDGGVPSEYADQIAKLSKCAKIYTVAEGEDSKSFATLEKVVSAMMDFKMTRFDALVAVGGGVVGDLGGFAASIYMRGVDFYNIPTTLLSQVDSSIGGKAAVNLNSAKNVVGAFYQPKAVLIDTDTLKTLSQRHINAGLAEVIKMAATSDSELFELLENENFNSNTSERIILGALKIKKAVVEEDEKEKGLRKILNFGHTLGHGIEADSGMAMLYHGECVALGMIPVSSEQVRKRLLPILKKFHLPTEYNRIDEALNYVSHDKKANDGSIDVILCEKIGSFKIKKMSFCEFNELIKKNLR